MEINKDFPISNNYQKLFKFKLFSITYVKIYEDIAHRYID